MDRREPGGWTIRFVDGRQSMVDQAKLAKRIADVLALEFEKEAERALRLQREHADKWAQASWCESWPPASKSKWNDLHPDARKAIEREIGMRFAEYGFASRAEALEALGSATLMGAASGVAMTIAHADKNGTIRSKTFALDGIRM